MPRKERKNKRRVGADVTPTQSAWLAGEWCLGIEPRSVDDTMEAISLMSNALGQCEALWQAHGDEDKFFWRVGMRLPITLSDLENEEACWLESAEGDNDLYGGDSYFIWHFYSDIEKTKLWNEHGDKELYHWEPLLRRPIPKGASVDVAMVAFTTHGPFNIA